MDASLLTLTATGICGTVYVFNYFSGRHTNRTPTSPALTAEARSIWNTVASFLAAAFIPLLIILVIRIGIAEPFRIPSGSMMPGLLSGDFILVDKSVWGVKPPWIGQTLIPARTMPARGDVAVFRFPKDPSIYFVKRLIGLPGDHIQYKNKHLTINGLSASYAPSFNSQHLDQEKTIPRFSEHLPGVALAHDIASELGSGAFVVAPELLGSCVVEVSSGSFDCVVPPHSYFAMGDNRDHSADSRFWGFVPEANLVGRAFLIWLSLHGMEHIGWIR